MIQEITPHIYHNEFVPRQPEPSDFVFVCRGDSVLLQVISGQITLPTLGLPGLDPGACRSLFREDSTWYSMLREDGPEPPEGFGYFSKNQYREFGESTEDTLRREELPPDTAHLSLTAEMIDVFRRGLA